MSALDNITPIKSCDASHRKTNLNNTLKILIAFALIERTEGDDMQSSSSRSSKRSFDKHAEYLDLLRIHSVVQAYFIDTLHEEHQADFWLERAIAMWCKAYDEADRRIQEDVRVGLPDDYRRFAIHGEKLVQNLDRFEKRYPQVLSGARLEIEARLQRIEGQIDQLSHAIQANIVNGSTAEQPASVFDRSNTLSETDSAATLPSHDSGHSWGRFRAEDGETPDAFQSPILFDPSNPTSPSEWQAPYPTTPLMPPVPNVLEDETIVTTKPVPTEPPVSDLQRDPYGDWQGAIPSHRVLERQKTRRYHDRGGSWRDFTISDPRTDLNRDIVMGSLSSRRTDSRSPSRHRVTAQSDAEMELNKIKKAMPPLPPIEPIGGSSNGNPVRPSMLLGRNSYSQVSAKKVPETEFAVSPVPFTSGLAQIMSSPKSWTAATVKKLKENMLPSRTPALAVPTSPIPVVSQRDDAIVPPGPIFRGSRTTNSSPAGRSSPFPPPTFSAHPDEVNGDDFAHPNLPLSVRRWDSNVYHPGLVRLGSSGVEAPDPLSQSYPFLGPSHQDQHHYPNGPPSATRAPQPLPISIREAAPSGYTSQPLSHQSTPSIHDPYVPSSPASAPSSSSTHMRHPLFLNSVAHHSSPLGLSTSSSPDNHADGSHPSSLGGGLNTSINNGRLLPFFAPSRRGRSRRPSYAETEPSPRRDAAFPDVDTSYARWEQLQHYHHRQQQQQQPLDLASTTPSGGVKTQWRIGRGSGRVSTPAAMSHRSQSHSPSPSLSRIFKIGTAAAAANGGAHPLAVGYPNSNIAQQQGPTSPDLLGAWGSGGEPMSRSGSGGSTSSGVAGIRVGDRTVVEFGTSGAAAAAGGKTRRRSVSGSGSGGYGLGLGISQ